MYAQNAVCSRRRGDIACLVVRGHVTPFGRLGTGRRLPMSDRSASVARFLSVRASRAASDQCRLCRVLDSRRTSGSAAAGPPASSASKPASSRIGTPSCTALSYFAAPGRVADHDVRRLLADRAVTLPPRDGIASAATSREYAASVPVTTTVSPSSGPGPPDRTFVDRRDAAGGQPLDDVAVPLVGEPLGDRGRDRRADAVDAASSLDARAGDRVERAELAGERLRRRRPDVADRQPDEQPPQRPVPRRLEAVQDLLDLLRPEAAQPLEADSAVRWKTSPMSLIRPASSSAIAVS